MANHPDHICRFNDGEQTCDCYDVGYKAGLLRAAEIARTLQQRITTDQLRSGGIPYVKDSIAELIKSEATKESI